MKQKSAYFTMCKTESKIITEIENRVATRFNKRSIYGKVRFFNRLFNKRK